MLGLPCGAADIPCAASATMRAFTPKPAPPMSSPSAPSCQNGSCAGGCAERGPSRRASHRSRLLGGSPPSASPRSCGRAPGSPEAAAAPPSNLLRPREDQCLEYTARPFYSSYQLRDASPTRNNVILSLHLPTLKGSNAARSGGWSRPSCGSRPGISGTSGRPLKAAVSGTYRPAGPLHTGRPPAPPERCPVKQCLLCELRTKVKVQVQVR